MECDNTDMTGASSPYRINFQSSFLQHESDCYGFASIPYLLHQDVINGSSDGICGSNIFSNEAVCISGFQMESEENDITNIEQQLCSVDVPLISCSRSEESIEGNKLYNHLDTTEEAEAEAVGKEE
jgi:hypothetical protein